VPDVRDDAQHPRRSLGPQGVLHATPTPRPRGRDQPDRRSERRGWPQRRPRLTSQIPLRRRLGGADHGGRAGFARAAVQRSSLENDGMSACNDSPQNDHELRNPSSSRSAVSSIPPTAGRRDRKLILSQQRQLRYFGPWPRFSNGSRHGGGSGEIPRPNRTRTGRRSARPSAPRTPFTTSTSRAPRPTRAAPGTSRSPLEHAQVPVEFPVGELDAVLVPLLPLQLDVAVEDVRAERLPREL
jgi:hypothetical protein